MNDYRAALERLRAEGLVYRCFKTRAELMDGLSPAGGRRGAAAGGRQALRLAIVA
jgi:glutamyl/glutaminyl-tRNA synthetase